MCSKFQYVGAVSIIILKENFLWWCFKIPGLETKSLWMSRLGSRDKQTQKSDLSEWPLPAGKFDCLEIDFYMAKF